MYVVLVPLVKGGTWTDDEQLATVVHDRLGRDGVFVGLKDTGDSLSAHEFGGEHQARDAAWAVELDRGMDDASLVARLSRFADLLISGTGTREYKRISKEIDERYRSRHGGSAVTGGGAGVPPAAVGAAGAAVAGIAGLLVWRRRRMAAVHRADTALLLPRTVFSTARPRHPGPAPRAGVAGGHRVRGAPGPEHRRDHRRPGAHPDDARPGRLPGGGQDPRRRPGRPRPGRLSWS